MIVADTNVIFPLYVRSARSSEALALYRREPVWRTEPFVLIELSNILATYERAGHISKASAEDGLVQAEEFLTPHFQAVSHKVALEIARRYQITVYDARFLAVAAELGMKLTTEDTRLRKAVPGLTQSLTEALATP